MELNRIGFEFVRTFFVVEDLQVVKSRDDVAGAPLLFLFPFSLFELFDVTHSCHTFISSTIIGTIAA